jgi:DNA-binding Lrp family transcriptional regulator
MRAGLRHRLLNRHEVLKTARAHLGRARPARGHDTRARTSRLAVTPVAPSTISRGSASWMPNTPQQSSSPKTSSQVPWDTPDVSRDRYTVHTDGVTWSRKATAKAEPSPVRPNAAAAVISTTAHTDASTTGRFGTPPPRRASSTASSPDKAVAETAGTIAVQKHPDYLLRVAARDLDSFAALRDQKLATLPGVHRLTSTIVMKRIVDNRPLPLAT